MTKPENKAALPALPLAYEYIYGWSGGHRSLSSGRWNGMKPDTSETVYTRDQMHAYLLADRASRSVAEDREGFVLVRNTCPHCKLSDVAISLECHNSDCSGYAHCETLFEGWKTRPAAPKVEVPAVAPSELPGPSGDVPSDFQEGQWWLVKLDEVAAAGTDDMKRAVAVVRNLMKTAHAQAALAQPTPSADRKGASGEDSSRLDWLEQAKRFPLNCYNMKGGFEGFTFHASWRDEKHMALRDAIDAAMQPAATPSERAQS